MWVVALCNLQHNPTIGQDYVFQMEKDMERCEEVSDINRLEFIENIHPLFWFNSSCSAFFFWIFLIFASSCKY